MTGYTTGQYHALEMVSSSDAGRSEISTLRDIESALELAEPHAEGTPLSLAPDFSEVVAELRSVLSVPEIAHAVGVKERQVHHWLAGTHSPKGAARDRLLVAFQVVRELQVALDDERIRVWLSSPQPDLSARPIDCLQRNDQHATVLQAARELSIRSHADDTTLVRLAKDGNANAYDAIVRRYRGFVRLKAASYSLVNGEPDDLIQEGLLGLYKAIRDFSPDGRGTFRNFAELCITRQIIVAVKTATRHRTQARLESSSVEPSPLQPGGDVVDGLTLDGLLSQLADSSGVLTAVESRVLSLYLDGIPDADIAQHLGLDVQEIDGLLGQIKRKVAAHIVAQEAPASL